MSAASECNNILSELSMASSSRGFKKVVCFHLNKGPSKSKNKKNKHNALIDMSSMLSNLDEICKGFLAYNQIAIATEMSNTNGRIHQKKG